MAAESSWTGTGPSGRYHSTSEFTIPKSSRLISSGGDVGAQGALVDGGLDEAGELVVDHAPALERGELDLAVAAHAQQQGHGRQVVDRGSRPTARTAVRSRS